MSILSRLRSAFPGQPEGPAKSGSDPDGEVFLTFASTGEVIQAEKILKAEGLAVRIMAPPPAMRTGCDMVVVVSLPHAFRAAAVLKKQALAPLQIIPAEESLLKPMSLFQTKDYGQWLMVRAANMKLTVEKASGRIVNVSGGGCPDVPYLAARLIGKKLDDEEVAEERGRTLCGYALHLAAQELRGRRSSLAREKSP